MLVIHDHHHTLRIKTIEGFPHPFAHHSYQQQNDAWKNPHTGGIGEGASAEGLGIVGVMIIRYY